MPGSENPAPETAGRVKSRLPRRIRREDLRQAGLPLAVLVLFIIFTLNSSVFFTPANFQNVGLAAAALALVSFGQCFVVLTAGIDLSVGSTVALVSVVAAKVMESSGPVVGVLAGLAAGIAVGVVNGFVVTRLKVVPFVATLAMLSIAAGLALSLSGGTPVSGLPSSFTDIASTRLLGVPLPAVIALAFFVIAWVILRFSRIGRHIYAVGGNLEAARLSGIQVERVAMSSYVICSTFAAFGALVLTARVASGQPTLGSDLALQSVAAVVLGGVSLFGGRGSVVGVLFGVIFVSVLSNGLNLVGVSSYTQMLVLGTALIAVLAIDWRLFRDAD
ncbi:MAG: ABC transporter permease [Thermoleophilia bacterium]|nr:ABC transporter permease [Thermoleophilia bacterium]